MTSPLRVLVVDDVELAASTLRAVLQRAGYDVTVAASLAAAREEIEHVMPDVMLLDRWLPDGDGVELVRELRSSSGAGPTRIVVMSGEPLQSDQLGGADAFLLKPAGVRQVLAALRDER